MVVIETERLVLRHWRNSDIDLFIAMNQDEEVMRHFLKVLTPEESLEDYKTIQTEIEQKGYGLFAVETKNNQQFIGFIGLHHFDFSNDFGTDIEIAWRLQVSAWGQGYATEGAKACLEYAHLHLGCAAVVAFTAHLNRPSERVMQKIGMQKIKAFAHPKVPVDHPLSKHNLYRISWSTS